jgi:hypothetical protein
MKKCEVEGCDFPIFGKKCCKKHYPKTPLKKTSKLLKKSYLSKQPTEKAIAKKEEKKEYTQKQWQFFLKIWNSRPHVSFESGLPIYGEPTSTMFHHCLEKGIEKYKKYALEDWNIVLLLPSEHNQVHTDISKTPKVKEYTEKLKEKYGK